VPAQPVTHDHVGLREIAVDRTEVERTLVGEVRPERLVHERGTVGQRGLRVDDRG
jgi:hypothetical protein